MKFRFLKPVLFVLVFITGNNAMWVFAEDKPTRDIELITNTSNSIDTLEMREVRAIFSMRLKVWPNNQPIQVFVLEQNNLVHEQFSKDILKVFPHQLQAGWDRLVFSGTGEAPTVVGSEEKMIEAIRATPGSIGYILKEEKPHEDIKIVHIK